MRVMIGEVVMRAADGSFLPGGTPIYRELPDREEYQEPLDYYDFDDFAAQIAEGYQADLSEKRKATKEKKKRKENTT